MQTEERLHRVTRTIVVVATITALVAIGIGAADVAAAQTEDGSEREDFDQDNSTASNNVTIENGEIRIKRENLSWDVDNLTFKENAPFEGGSSTAHNLEWGRNGTRFYVIDAAYGVPNSELIQYNLAEPWNLSTASFAESELWSFYQGLEWGRQGTRLYMADVTNDTIDTFEVTDPWNVSTASVLGTTDYSADLNSDPTDVQWSPGGEHFYYLTEQKVHRATPLTSWFPNSPETTFNLPTEITSARNFEFQDGNTNLNISGLSSGDYVQATDSTSDSELDVTGDITIAAQINISRPLDVNNNNNYRRIIGRASDVGNTYSVIFEEGGTIDWSVFKSGSRENARGCNFPVGKPFDLVVTHEINTGESAIWINGTECHSQTVASGLIDQNNDDLFISSDLSNRQFPGEIDRVRIAERKWNDDEIRDYANDKPVPATNRRVEYDFDLGNGTTAQDTAGTANDGTINNPEWVSGSFGGAGDRLFVLDNKDGTVVDDDTLYEIELGHNFGLSSMTLTDSTGGTAGLRDDTDNRGMAWMEDGEEVVLSECCETGIGKIEIFDAGFRDDASARYRYTFGPGPFEEILEARLNWTDDESNGTNFWYLGNGDSPIHYHNVTNEEDVWQDFSDQNKQALHVRVDLTWGVASAESPSATIFELAADFNDAQSLNLTVPEEMDLNESANYDVCVLWENGTCTDVSQDPDTDVTVNRTDVLQVFKTNTTLRSNTNSSWVAVNASTSADLQTLVANESTLVYGNRLQDYRFIDDEIMPIVVFTDWGWLALLVIATIAALVAREVGVDLGIATFGGLVVVAWILGFVELEIVIVSILLVGILISR